MTGVQMGGGSQKSFSDIPRVLVVSRRTVRKDKYIDYVGEFHLNLVVEHGAVPVILPRVPGILAKLDAYEPFHGILLVEGEDVYPGSYGATYDSLTVEQRARIDALYSADTSVDLVKDELELELVRRCLKRGAPILSICRGSQIVNVACGGSLYLDVATETNSTVVHYNADNYDGHRHSLTIEPNTPMFNWFKTKEIMVNSYHHCGIKKLASNLRPMAHSDDGLIEAYYDPSRYDPKNGRYLVGLQFHPERMQDLEAHLADQEPIYDYPGCKAVYDDFISAVRAFCISRSKSSLLVNNALERLSRTTSQGLYKKEQRTSRKHLRAHMTVHGGTMALSLLREGLDPFEQMNTEFLVSEDDVSIGDGKFVVAIPDELEVENPPDGSSTQFEEMPLSSTPLAPLAA